MLMNTLVVVLILMGGPWRLALLPFVIATQKWNVPITRHVGRVGNNTPIFSVKFSPNGSSVVFGDNNGNLHLWVLGRDKSTLNMVGSNGGYPIDAVDFSPDGSSVVFGDQNGNLTLWAVAGATSAWGPITTICNRGSRIISVKFSPDGSMVVSGDYDANLDLWAIGNDQSGFKRIKTVNNQGVIIKSFDFAPDGSNVVSGDDNGHLNLWAVGGPSIFKTVGTNGCPILTVNFSPDGSAVVSGDFDGNLNLWRVNSDQATWPVRTVGRSGSQVTSVRFSPDGSWVVSTANKNLNLWAVGNGQTTWELQKSFGDSDTDILSVDFSPDSSLVVSGDFENLNLWAVGGEPSTWGFLETIGNSTSNITSVDFSTDGVRVVSGDTNGNLQVWAVGGNKSTWGLLKTISNQSSDATPVECVDFSPNGSMVVSGDTNGNVDLWAARGDPSTWAHLRTLGNGGPFVRSVRFSPDGAKVVSADMNHTDVWAVGGDPSSWKLLKDVSGRVFRCADFSPDGSKVVAGDIQGNLYLWDVGEEPSIFKTVGRTRSPINSIRFFADGSRVLSAHVDGSLNLWAVADDQPTWPFQMIGKSASPIWSISLGDGSMVISGDDNGRLEMWAVGGDPSTRGLLKTVGNSGARIWSVNISPNGSTVVSGDGNGRLNMWAVAGSTSSFWRASPRFAFLIVVNQYPGTLQEFMQAVACESELYGGGSYEVCNVTINQPASTYLMRSSVQEVEELLSFHLPILRINFAAGADLSGLLAQDLPIAWRTVTLRLRNTQLPSSAPDLFRFLNQSSPFVEELDISGTLVAGPITARPPLLRKMQCANAHITYVTWEFFLDSMELLDIRNTPYLEHKDAALNSPELVFRRGVPSCSLPLEGKVLDGTLCKICEPGWHFDGCPTCQLCVQCPSYEAKLTVLTKILVLIGVVFLLAALAYAGKKHVQRLLECLDCLKPYFSFLGRKAGLCVFAYQKVSQLKTLGTPLPPSTQYLVSFSSIFNPSSLFNYVLFTFIFCGESYYWEWMLNLVPVAVLLGLAYLVGPCFGVSKRESLSFVHKYTVMLVVEKTLPLFVCDDRLLNSDLPLMPTVRKNLLRVDYNTDCASDEHRLFWWLGLLVLIVYGILAQVVQLIFLLRAWSVINPPLLGQPAGRLTPEHYLTVARDELRRLDAGKHYPSTRLGQAPIVEAATIREREGLSQEKREFTKDVEMVSEFVPSKWWWFFVPATSQVLLGCISLCQPQNQPFLGCVLCVTLGCGVILFRPHLRPSDNQHEMLCQVCVGFAFALRSVQPSTPSWLPYADITLLCLPPLAVFVHLRLLLPAWKPHRQLNELASSITSQEPGIELLERAQQPTLEETTQAGSASNP